MGGKGGNVNTTGGIVGFHRCRVVAMYIFICSNNTVRLLPYAVRTERTYTLHKFNFLLSFSLYFLSSLSPHHESHEPFLCAFFLYDARRYKGFLKDCPNGLLTEQVSRLSRLQNGQAANIDGQ